jgi:uncharacterized protein DUF6868
MESTGDQNVFLETCSAILIRCFLIELAVLLLWFFIFLFMGGLAFKIHSAMFAITRHDFDLMNYYGMAFMKMSAFLLFLCPYLSIRLVMRKK